MVSDLDCVFFLFIFVYHTYALLYYRTQHLLQSIVMHRYRYARFTKINTEELFILSIDIKRIRLKVPL